VPGSGRPRAATGVSVERGADAGETAEASYARDQSRYSLAGPASTTPCTARTTAVLWKTHRMKKPESEPVVARNRKARHDYHLEDTWEAGIVLQGSEVKALRAGRASLVDGFADVEDGEIWLHGVHIPQYAQATWTNHASRRKRKLLLHRREIDKIERRVNESGLTVIPLSLYFKDGRAKVEIALARGKKTWDKRHSLAERQATREVEQAVGRRLKGMPD
jgi:SsrA-binding protein